MSKNTLAVPLHVEQARLATVLAALDGTATLVSVTSASAPAVEASPPPKERPGARYHNGVRNKGISGEQLVLQVLKESNGLAGFTKFAGAFAAYGFAKNSASPALSEACSKQLIRALGGGQYALPGTKVHLGASV